MNEKLKKRTPKVFSQKLCNHLNNESDYWNNECDHLNIKMIS